MKRNEIETVQKPNINPEDRYRFIPQERRKEVYEILLQERERKASLDLIASLEARYHELRKEGNFELVAVLHKIDKERQFAIKRGWITLPWEVEYAV